MISLEKIIVFDSNILKISSSFNSFSKIGASFKISPSVLSSNNVVCSCSNSSVTVVASVRRFESDTILLCCSIFRSFSKMPFCCILEKETERPLYFYLCLLSPTRFTSFNSLTLCLTARPVFILTIFRISNAKKSIIKRMYKIIVITKHTINKVL